MWVFPSVAAIVAFAFAGALARQFVRRRRSYQALWCAALLMYGVASAAVALGAANGWTSGEFRVYWALGAVLNVPFLAQGELDLLVPNRTARSVLYVVLAFVTAYTIARVRTAAVDPVALAERLPSGKEVFGDGTPAHRLPQLVSIPAYLVLVGGTLWSAWRMRGRAELRDRLRGTVLIAIGATVIAVFGSAFAAQPRFAGLSLESLGGQLLWFSVALLAGITIMFWGFLRASRSSSGSPTRTSVTA
jgi:hypothetical protein